MTDTHELARAIHDLEPDPWRAEHPFTMDLEIVQHDLLETPFRDPEAAQHLRNWLQRYQPCTFGRVTAASDQIHFCFIRDRDIDQGDSHVRELIRNAKRLWKYRAIDPPDPLTGFRPPHTFALCLLSRRVAEARPDARLKRVAEHLRGLAEWHGKDDPLANDVAREQIFIRHPVDGVAYAFAINIDFFAAAGDGRWWHDHRAPGGMMLTANGIGHMIRYRQWYLRPEGEHNGESTFTDASKWSLRQAMRTIYESHPARNTDSSSPGSTRSQQESRESGRATWLLDVPPGKVRVPQVRCPFENPDRSLYTRNKDWTGYEGLYHTDHSVRDEFFLEQDRSPYEHAPLIMDLAYLADPHDPDFIDLVYGTPVSEDVVQRAIGRPQDRRQRAGSRDTDLDESQLALIDAALERSSIWALSHEELQELLR